MTQAQAVATIERPTPAAGTYELDRSHTTVGFQARHLMVSKVKGRFTDFSGTLVIADRPEDSSVDVTIQAASVDTRDEQRDGHLRSADFFDVEQYPTIRFTSTKVEAAGDRWRVTGDLTIQATTKPVVLDVEFNGAADSPFGTYVAGFEASTEIDREDWNLTWNVALETGGFLVGKKIRIELDVEAVKVD